MKHEFIWNSTPFEFETEFLGLQKYEGAVQCKNCGLRAPCKDEFQGRRTLEFIAGCEDDGNECESLLAEKILSE